MKKIFLLICVFLLIKQGRCQVWTATAIQPDNEPACFLNDTVNNFFYAGGFFNSIGTMPVNYIARWDGISWDSLGAGFNSSVRCLTLYNGELYAGGYFTTSGTTPVSYIAKWNGASWQPLGSGLNDVVSSLAVFNGELYAAGAFTVAGAGAANHVAKWDGNTWTPLGSGADALVLTLYVFNGDLYAGGFFTHAGGISCNCVAKWDGLAWSSLGNGLNNTVRSISEYNGNIHVTGDFTLASGTSANYVAMWNGSQWSALGNGLDDGGDQLCVYNSELYVTGFFTSAGGVPTDGIARWNGFGWNAVGTCGGTKSPLATYGGDLYVGGSTLLNNASNNLIKWNNPPPFPPSAAFFANDTISWAGGFVEFTNQSIGSSLTYNWSFPGGNPATSVSANPIINYAVPGFYDVMLVAANGAGTDTLIKTTYIYVDNVPHHINFGVSTDYVKFEYDHTFYTTITPNVQTEIDTAIFGLLKIYYYKPANYDSVNSPILWGVHGLGGNGNSEIADLQAIADRRHALIVSVSMASQFNYNYISYQSQVYNGSYFYSCFSWYPSVFRQIYRHILSRENRSPIPVHLIGFSEGGQFVSRYMLVRQGVADSIPIKMAVSTSPFGYTFCTDTFLTTPMYYPCGLLPGIVGPLTDSLFNCNEQVIQYYNENYGVLIGTADTLSQISGGCEDIQGDNRYERAQNFYAFSDSNAITRGTTLKWPYAEVPGVGHYQPYMYNVKQNVNDSSTIAEALLFDTPYHNVPSLTPLAGFVADTTIINVNGTINFTNTSMNATTFEWDFGDNTTSTNVSPSHSYTSVDTFTVKLSASDNNSCGNKAVKRKYIIVKMPAVINEIKNELSYIKVYPNPNKQTTTISFANPGNEKVTLFIYDFMGKLIETKSNNSSSFLINKDSKPSGIYFFNLFFEESKRAENGRFLID